MILAIDIGNTNIVIGLMESHEKISFVSRISTDHLRTSDQYAIELSAILHLNNATIDSITGAVISSVVPPLSAVIAAACEKATGVTPMHVGKGIKTGLNIMIDNPAQLGADLVVCAVAALRDYTPPITIFDMGTATTMSYIDKNSAFRGGAIMPGVIVSHNALISKTSQLQRVSFEPPRSVVGPNTIDALQSGLVFATAAMIDGMIDRIDDEMGIKSTVISTGGLAKYITPYCKRQIIYDANLMLCGLYELYVKNYKG